MKLKQLGIAVLIVLSASFCSAEGAAQETAQAEEAKPANLLSFDQAFKLSIEQNASIKKAVSDLKIARANVDRAYGMFDVKLNGGVTYSESKNEVTSIGAPEATKVLAYNAGLARKMETGGFLGLDLKNTRSLLEYPAAAGGPSLIPGFDFSSMLEPEYNPSYSPALNLTYTQPLLKNFWGRPDQVGIKIGELSVKMSEDALKEAITGHVKALRESFYLIGMTRRSVEIQKGAFADTEKFYNQSVRLKKTGLREEKDVLQTRASMLSAKAEVAPAENGALSAKEAFFNLIGLDPQKWDETEVDTQGAQEDVYIPEELSGDLEATLIDVQPAVSMAKFAFEMAKMNKRISDNMALPELNLFGSYGLTGTDSGLNESFDKLKGGRYNNFAVGANVTFFLPDRNGGGDLAVKDEEVKKAEEAYNSAKKGMKIMIRAAYRKLVSAKEDYEMKSEAAGLQKKRLKIEEENFNQGRISTQQLLMAQTDYHVSQFKEAGSFLEYMKALSDWNKITGKYDGYYNEYFKEKGL